MTAEPVLVVLGPSGLQAAQRIAAMLPGCSLHAPRTDASGDAIPYDDLASLLRALHAAGRPIVGVCAASILIRLLAPLLGDKRAEPPVVAVADDGSFAVPLLGGHRGANRLAQEIADALDGAAAITTAGDVRFDLALDAPPPGWRVRNPAAAKAVMSALLAGADVALRQESGDAAWLTKGGARFAPAGDLEVLLTDRDEAGSERRLWCCILRSWRWASAASAASPRPSSAIWSGRR